MKKVLIISTSIRSGSNSEFLAHEFEKGAKEAGNDVTFISLKDKIFLSAFLFSSFLIFVNFANLFLYILYHLLIVYL